MSKKIGLVILDGWGHGNKSNSDAVYNAKTPNMDKLYSIYPHSELITFGEQVGLPNGQMGNSEVGHLNIGAGRIVYQELTRINKSITNNEFFKNQTLIKAFDYAKKKKKKVHFMGLLSNGGVHSSKEHLYALIEMAEKQGVTSSYIHAFTDGRDCDPKSGVNFLIELEEKLKQYKTKLATVCGRYYAMDRDNRWGRIKKAYDLFTKGKGEFFLNCNQMLKKSYSEGITDEFITPKICNKDGLIEEEDLVICFNFRTDRCREITRALTQEDFLEFGMKKLKLYYCTMTNYDQNFKNIQVIFDKENLQNTLGEMLSKNNKTQVRIAETEKYPHVTFFFSGGREEKFENEKRLLLNSPKVTTYDLQPEMSAFQIKDKIIEEIKENKPDFFCLNFANPDMVGHTGDYQAIIKAVETVDQCLGEIIEEGKKEKYSFLVISDHGNADVAINPDGSPNTSHSLNPVPIIVVDEDVKKIKKGKLADVAPSILKMMNLIQPKEMNGESLV